MDRRINIIKKFLLVIIPLALLYTAATVFVNIKFPETVIKERINEYFKNNINKAVKFDSIDISVFSKLVINNFKISNGNDFNDNLPLISCKKFTIDFSLFSIITGKPSVTAFKFDNPDINFIKPYGKNYKESVYRSFTDVTRDIFVRIIKDGRILEIENGKITYKEMFPEEEQTFVIDKLNIKLLGGDKEGNFNCNGNVKNNKSNMVNYGNFEFEGLFEVDENGNLIYSNTVAEFEDMDLSYINPYLKTTFSENINSYGLISGKVLIKTFYNNIFNQTSLNLENVKIIGETTKEQYVNGKNFTINLIMNKDTFGATSLSVKAKPESLPEIKISFQQFKGTINDVNNLLFYLDIPQSSISQYNKVIAPVQGLRFLGKISAYSKIMCDVQNGYIYDVVSDIKLIDAEIKINKPEVIPVEKISVNLDSKVTNNNSIRTKMYGNVDSSDYNIAILSYVKNWNPFFSDNNIKYESDTVYLEHISFLYNKIKSFLSTKAYEDLNKGYKEINFRERSYGKFINNNNFDLEMEVGLLKLDGNAKLKDLETRITLYDGSLKSQPLILQGYNAVYNFSIDSFFKSDYPKLTCSLEIKNFDFASYYKESGKEGELTDSVLNYKEELELTGHSPGHIIENGHYTRSFNITAKKADKTAVQSQFNDMFKTNNYNVVVTSLENINFNYEFGFNNGNARLRSMNFTSNIISFSVAGIYEYKKGYNLPFYVSFRDASGKSFNEKFILTGFNKNDGLMIKPSFNDKTLIKLY